MANKILDELIKKTETVTEPVCVYYCACGKSIECASHPSLIKHNRETRKQFKQANAWGRKADVIPLTQFKETPFMCNGVQECIDKN